MAISKYSTPAEFKPESVYQRIPLEYLANTLQSRQQQYDLGLNEQNMLLENLAKVKSREEDFGALRSINQAYESELNSIAEATANDFGSSDFRNRLNKVKRKLGSDLSSGDLAAIQQNYNNFQDWNKRKLEEKDNYNPYLDQAYTKIAPGFYGGYKREDGTYNIASPGAIDKAVNREEVADNLIKGLASDASTGIRLSQDANGNTMIVTDKNERVTPQRISQVFRNSFGGSEAMTQIQREASFNEQMARRNGQEFDRNTFVQGKVADLERFVVNKYSSNKSDKDIKFNNALEWQQDKNSTPVFTPAQNGAAFTNPNVSTELSDEVSMGDPGFQNFVGQESRVQGRKQRPVDELYKAYYGNDKPPVPTETVKPQMDRVNRFLPTNEKFDKNSYVEAFNKGINNLKNITLQGEQIQKGQAEIYQDQLNRSKASALYNINGEQKTITQIAEENGVSPEEININPNLIHYESLDPNHKGANLEVSIEINPRDRSKSGRVIAGITPLNNNVSMATGIISEIGQNSIYKGLDTYTENNPLPYDALNADIHTVTIPKKKFAEGRELPFNTNVIITPRNGEKPITVTYDEFKTIVTNTAKSKLSPVINSGRTMNNTDIKR